MSESEEVRGRVDQEKCTGKTNSRLVPGFPSKSRKREAGKSSAHTRERKRIQVSGELDEDEQ